MTTTTQHTAASLAAIYDRNPRELDAIAAEVVMGQHVEWVGVGYDKDDLEARPIVLDVGTLPEYSTSLDAAALLEKALSERGLRLVALHKLLDMCGTDMGAGINIMDVQCVADASAKDRTIAAVLAAQEAKPIPPAPISVTEVYDDETGQLLAQYVDSIYGSPTDNNINLWMAMGRKLRFTSKMMEAKC